MAIACSPATPAPMIEDLGRRHGARCGHQHRHHPVELGETVDHGPVAGEIGLARQHVHALGAGGARQQLQGERDHARLGVGRHLLRILVGIEHADQDLSRAQQRHLVERALALGKRPPHLEHDVRIAIDRPGIVHQPGAGIGEALVDEAGGFAGPRLDQRVDPAADQPLHRVGSGRDARLASPAFLGDAYLHRFPPCCGMPRATRAPPGQNLTTRRPFCQGPVPDGSRAGAARGPWRCSCR